MKNNIVLLTILLFLNACGNSSLEKKTSHNITVERGPVFNAYIEDNKGNVAINNNSNLYTFKEEIAYPITLKLKNNFNTFIDLDNDYVYSKGDKILDIQMKSYSKIITPITTYIANRVENSSSNLILENKIKEEYELLEKRLNISSKELNILPSQMINKNTILLTNSIYFLIKEKKDLNAINITDIENKINELKYLVKDFTNNIDLEKKLFKLIDLEKKENITDKTIEIINPVIDEKIEVIEPLIDEKIEVINPLIEEKIEIIDPLIEEKIEIIDPKIILNEIYPSAEYISNIQVQRLDKNTILFNNLEYKIITSPITGVKWLDRNLGASKVCTDYKKKDDWYTQYRDEQKDCFGDYYQWGRLNDGHEKINSLLSKTRSQILNVSNEGKFISVQMSRDRKNMDWIKTTKINSKKREDFWSGVNDVSICPKGFKVPSGEDFMKETYSFTNEEDISKGIVKIKDLKSAFQNFLKLASSNSKLFTGELFSPLRGAYWTSEHAHREDAWSFSFPSRYSMLGTIQRANANTIRCVENKKD